MLPLPAPPMNLTIHGCYDIQNFGDVLLQEMLAARLTESFGTKPVVPMVGRRGRVRWLGQFKNSDYCIWGGGGYFSDTGSYRHDIGHLSKYVLPAATMQSAGVPYSLLCPGAGPLDTWLGRNAARYICNGARLIIVRDEESRELIASTGIAPDRIQVAADFVLSLQPSSIPASATQRATELLGPASPGTRWVGVHLESMYRSNEKECTAAIESLVEACRNRPEVRLAFISDHSLTAHTHFQRFIAGEGERHRSIPRQDIWTTLALLKRLNGGVITSKLHVGIAGYSVGVPVFSLWTHPKTPRFYRMIGRSDAQAPFQNWREVLPAWISRLGSDAEAARFVGEYARKEGFTRSINAGYAAICADIIAIAGKKPLPHAA